MRILLILVALTSFQCLSAQDLHVFYNAYSDSVYFVQNGRQINKPAVRKGSHVILHIDNFNNYLYGVTVKTQQNRQSTTFGKTLGAGPFPPSGGFNPLNLIFGAIGNTGGLNFPGFSIDGDESGFASDDKAEQERQALIKELQALETTFRKTQDVIKVLDEDLAAARQKIESTVESQQIQVLAADAINKIKYNPKLEPLQIKKLTLDYMTHVFGDADPKKLDLRELLQKTKTEESVVGLKQEYDKDLQQYATNVDAMKLGYIALQDPKYDFDNSAVSQFRSSTQKYIANVDKNLQTYRSDAAMLDTAFTNLKGLSMDALMQLQADYITLKDDYTLTSRHKVEGDKLDLEIVFTPVDSIQFTGVATKRVAPIEINVYGGLQIKGAIGLGFGGFFQRPGEYFVRDSIITSSEKDAFTPILTSFAHFYSQGQGAVSAGGSFGIGVPIGGGSGFASLSFFLGPSLVIGRQQNIAISAGLMGGRVDELSGGYAVGDRFEAGAELLQTKPVYKLGYFLGLSFGLIGGN